MPFAITKPTGRAHALSLEIPQRRRSNPARWGQGEEPALTAEQEKADSDLKAERTRERRKSRPSLPAHLPEVAVVLEPASTACPCCSGAMHRICEDVSRRLDVVPAQYEVLVTRRPKYACRTCEGSVVQAPAPAA